MSKPSSLRQTIYDRRYGKPPGADELVKIWNDSLTNNLLSLVWKAYDLMYSNFLSHVSWDENYDDLERSITEELERNIRRVMDGFMPCSVQHGSFERETRAKPPAQPPTYDIAFIWNADPRIMWPLEAKVLKNDKATQDNLGDYVHTLQERYLQCKYAPFSNGGAMIGYLKTGDAETLLGGIELLIGSSLDSYQAFIDRYHRVSDHQRVPPIGKDYPKDFRCHHLVFSLSDAR